AQHRVYVLLALTKAIMKVMTSLYRDRTTVVVTVVMRMRGDPKASVAAIPDLCR
ncbi:hypothetical protein Pmar_PMAR022610, partial [Perkinsus marinus ATCC 50983]